MRSMTSNADATQSASSHAGLFARPQPFDQTASAGSIFQFVEMLVFVGNPIGAIETFAGAVKASKIVDLQFGAALHAAGVPPHGAPRRGDPFDTVLAGV